MTFYAFSKPFGRIVGLLGLVIGISKRLKVIAISLFAAVASFAEIAHCILDHLLRNRALWWFPSAHGRRLLSAHVNHGIEPEEIFYRIEFSLYAHSTLPILHRYVFGFLK